MLPKRWQGLWYLRISTAYVCVEFAENLNFTISIISGWLKVFVQRSVNELSGV